MASRRSEPKAEPRPSPIALSELLGVAPDALDNAGAFDAVLNADTPLFIDPVLLKGCQVPELSGSYDRIRNHFRQLMLVLTKCDNQGDIFWKQAEKMLTFPEVQSLCIGYARGKTSGRGSGRSIRNELLSTALEIMSAGLDDPEIFEIMGLIQPNVGPDRISDMAAGIIAADLADYTRRILVDVKAKEATPPTPLTWKDGIPLNPFNELPIILAPWSVLDDLPLALDRGTYLGFDVPGGDAREVGDAVREGFNNLIREAWSASTPSKIELKGALLKDPAMLRELLRRYSSRRGRAYDFKQDKHGYLTWNREGKRIAQENPLQLEVPENPTVADIERVATTICDHFRGVIEDNGVWRSLYGPSRTPLHEGYAQRIFFCIADVYCRLANIQVVPEANAGHGPVDFKLTRGYHDRVLVELKLTTNPQLCHGFTTQLERYSKAERTERTIYVVIDVEGDNDGRIEKFNKLRKGQATRYPIVRWVDGLPKESASKA